MNSRDFWNREIFFYEQISGKNRLRISSPTFLIEFFVLPRTLYSGEYFLKYLSVDKKFRLFSNETSLSY
ncbi:MAG: hypothetical protein KDK54_04780 [Leptospiraceae bacterium]|nr:hypothetical protein [Leptospiraceae bacterium]